ncbi:hypothetical protein EZJ43_16340 [Pedobacter changchengzhani]|uniref:Uncharacterized protein n=1 Tax=Pedobacter changchengzhani TaxID=2529274 RepID=A0A4R5MHD3_9SPHI|nr:hypothetical protein [Pedobacter changchengzhani]TDG34922.1 hypothetical protein EZJ43_16340 [Pedobacter changchengzhani]
MTKSFIILLISMLGFASIPSVTFACGSKTEKSCTKKDNPKKTISKECCEDGTHQASHKDNCNDGCNHKSCHCVAVHYNLTILDTQEINTKNFEVLNNDQKFSYVETYLTSGFYSIWTPPNIS